MTPSMTAWPPIARGGAGASLTPAPLSALRAGPVGPRSARSGSIAIGVVRRSRELLLLRVPLVEALDATAGVYQLLLARVEGVALGAQLDAELAHGGAGHELVAARALDLALGVRGVDVGLHDPSSLGRASSPATRTGYSRPGGAGGVSPRASVPWRSRPGTRRSTWSYGACPATARGPGPTSPPGRARS